MRNQSYELPATFGELLDRLFYRRGTPHALAIRQFYYFMTEKHPTNIWLSSPQKRNAGRGADGNDSTVHYTRFTRRMKRAATPPYASYTEGVALIFPLIDFYKHVSRSVSGDAADQVKISEPIGRRSLDLAMLVQRSMMIYLSQELSGGLYTWLPQPSDLFTYVQHPERYSGPDDEQFKIWYARCINGDADLYCGSYTIFRLTHLNHLCIDVSLPVAKLAVNLARCCIAYADYGSACKICDALTEGADSRIEKRSLNSDQLQVMLLARRVLADAAAYRVVESSQEELAVPFDDARRLLIKAVNYYADELGDLKYIYERDILNVRIRAYARARLLHSLRSRDRLDGHYYPEDQAHMKRLRLLIETIDLKYGHDLRFSSRYVHWDTLCRGALLLPKLGDLEVAESLHRDLKDRSFSADEVEKGLLLEAGKPELVDTHREYRETVTEIILACQRASISLPGKGHDDAIEAAQKALKKVSGMALVKNLFHGQIELALLMAKVLQIGG